MDVCDALYQSRGEMPKDQNRDLERLAESRDLSGKAYGLCLDRTDAASQSKYEDQPFRWDESRGKRPDSRCRPDSHQIDPDRLFNRGRPSRVPLWIDIDGKACGLSNLQAPDVSLRHIRVYPHLAQIISDGGQFWRLVTGSDGFPGRDVSCKSRPHLPVKQYCVAKIDLCSGE
jgi:hypothetical protein